MGDLQTVYDRLWISYVKTTVDFWEHCGSSTAALCRAMQVVDVSMASMATMGHYSIYAALL